MEPKMQWVSPNEMQSKAVEVMLNGRQPETKKDWVLCVNFWAHNAAAGLEAGICTLMSRLFEVPLEDSEIRDIAKFQHSRKNKEV